MFFLCFYLHIKSNLCITKIPWINPCWHKTSHRFTHQQRKWLYVILSQRCHSSCLFVCNLIGPRGQRSHTLSSSFHPLVFTKTQTDVLNFSTILTEITNGETKNQSNAHFQITSRCLRLQHELIKTNQVNIHLFLNHNSHCIVPTQKNVIILCIA